MEPTIQLTGGRLAVTTGVPPISAPKRMIPATKRMTPELRVVTMHKPALKAEPVATVTASLFDAQRFTAGVPMPAIPPEPDLSVPERGTTGPRPIGDLLEPLQRIIAHPDRGRLMAEFCKRHL